MCIQCHALKFAVKGANWAPLFSRDVNCDIKYKIFFCVKETVFLCFFFSLLFLTALFYALQKLKEIPAKHSWLHTLSLLRLLVWIRVHLVPNRPNITSNLYLHGKKLFMILLLSVYLWLKTWSNRKSRPRLKKNFNLLNNLEWLGLLFNAY